MTTENKGASRRQFLTGAAAIGAGTVAATYGLVGYVYQLISGASSKNNC